MPLYRFKTFTTSYYFPKIERGQEYMYGLYSAYGSLPSKILWWLFRNVSLVRQIFAVSEENVDFPLETIRTLDGTKSKMAFNMGSPGVEQKISILGWNEEEQKPFFAKFSQSERARKLTKNEIRLYTLLKDTGLTPELYSYKESDEGIYLKTECLKGKRPANMDVNNEIVDLALKLSPYHLKDAGENENGLRTSLSHGDFCPWNILVVNGKMRLIDWEVADERPLGFDILTYICQISLLFHPEKELSTVIDENRAILERYFNAVGISDYTPYLHAFAKEKIAYEISKEHEDTAEKFRKLLKD